MKIASEQSYSYLECIKIKQYLNINDILVTLNVVYAKFSSYSINYNNDKEPVICYFKTFSL